MRLSPETHRHIEEFLRVHFSDAQLKLPRIKIYGGKFGRFITTHLKIGAITIGSRIVVSPKLVGRDALGRVTLPGWLLAHECVHVMQYKHAGLIGFFVAYLREYFKTLRVSGKLDAAARNDAYRAIRHEREAREAEDEYARWLAEQATRRAVEEIGKEPRMPLQGA
ncbi:MAG TPA: hypothetical protein VF666_06950 [Pyrinomonadaceae bacterium]|jgi:hypothetical protein